MTLVLLALLCQLPDCPPVEVQPPPPPPAPPVQVQTTTVMQAFTEIVPVQSCRGGRCGVSYQYRTVYRPVTVNAPQTPRIIAQPAPVPGKTVTIQGPGPTTTVNINICEDALDEVNARRARRGLRLFKRDRLLTVGALNCAKVRATYRIEGHTQNDFAHLPAGAQAASAGCAAAEDSWGWLSCCMDDPYETAGAAWVRGVDGKRYMHLFVR